MDHNRYSTCEYPLCTQSACNDNQNELIIEEQSPYQKIQLFKNDNNDLLVDTE